MTVREQLSLLLRLFGLFLLLFGSGLFMNLVVKTEPIPSNLNDASLLAGTAKSQNGLTSIA